MTRQMKSSGVEWIGDIPEKWNVRKLFQVFTQVKNKNQGMVETNLLSLSYGKIKQKNIETSFGLLPESFETYNIIDKNDIVLRLTDLQNDQKSLRVGLSTQRGIITSAYVTMRAKNPRMAPYLYYLLHTFDIEKGFYGMGDGVRQGLNWDELKHLSFVLPSLSEQQKIADYLNEKCGAIDEIIAKMEQSVEEYKKLKQAAITEAVTKGIRPNRKMKDSGIEWIGEIPEDWETIKLRYLYRCQNGISKSADNFGHGYPFVSYKDVYDNDVLPTTVEGRCEANEEERSRYSVQKGDIFFTRTSETIEEIGLTSICLETIDNATFAGFLIRCRPFTKKLIFGYSKYYTASSHLRFYFVKEMNLVIRASLSQDLLKNMKMLIPPLEEQKEIADYLDKKCAEIDTLIEKKQKFLTELATYKKSMIYEYVTGKKEVA